MGWFRAWCFGYSKYSINSTEKTARIKIYDSQTQSLLNIDKEYSRNRTHRDAITIVTILKVDLFVFSKDNILLIVDIHFHVLDSHSDFRRSLEKR